MKLKAVILAILTGGLLMGCCGKSELSKVSGTWETSGLEINGVAQEICVSDMTITVKGSNKVAFNGNSGVNSYFGSAVIKGNSFKAGSDAGSTKMAGDPAAMEFEDNFIATLMAADSVEVSQDNLTIKDSKSGNKITFTRK